MVKKLRQPVNMQEQLTDTSFSEILELCLDHPLIRDDFYFINDKDKDKEKRVDPEKASQVLLKETYLKYIRICINTKTSYMCDPLKGIYGPLTKNGVKVLLTNIIGRVEVEELLKPNYIDQIFKALKYNPNVAINGYLLFKGLNTKAT